MSAPEIPAGARAIQLHGKIAAGRIALVDAEDFALVSQYRWTVHESERAGRSSGPYAVAKVGPASKRRAVYLHRLITGWDRTDHENHNGLDNRRSNLREATRSQNGANQFKRQGCSSPFKGVYRPRGRRVWIAQIAVEGGGVRVLGAFSDEIEAARAYDRAAVATWGEFARANFPPHRAKDMRSSAA